MYDLDEVLRMKAKLPLRFLELMRRLGEASTDNILHAYEALARRYSAPHRHYHTLEHIAHAVVEFDRVAQYMQNPDRVLAALFYHDVMDTEEASALHWISAVGSTRMVADRDTIFEVVRMIRLTKHHTADPVRDMDTALCLDIDMSILGTDPVGYMRYRTRVREEYQECGDAKWAKGRSEQFLTPTLARARVFITDHFEQSLGTQARVNLEAELAEYRSMNDRH